MYRNIQKKLDNGQTIILDGGTGTDIQRRGAPMSGETWCAEVNLTHPDIVRAVHEDYIRAGADIITANTFASSALSFNHYGRDDDLLKIDSAAVAIAKRAAAGKPVAVAGSVSTMRPVAPGTDRTLKEREWPEAQARELFRRKIENLVRAEVDLLMMEMMRDTDYSVYATEAAIATGLPVWVGISVERGEGGKLVGFGREDQLLDGVAKRLAATRPAVMNIMHTSSNDTDQALDILRKYWKGPIGVYPECGYFKSPDWQFVDVITPQDLVGKSHDWQKQGASIFGGCCGIGPEHIAALAMEFKKKTGSCLCGAVKYEVHGPLRDVLACHCAQCRKQTGTYMSATAALDTDLKIVESGGLKWYRSSDKARRGFCGECGSVLFWKGDGLDYTSITAGSLDGATGLKLEGHIFCDNAGDYYEIVGGGYKLAQWS